MWESLSHMGKNNETPDLVCKKTNYCVIVTVGSVVKNMQKKYKASSNAVSCFIKVYVFDLLTLQKY